MLSFPPLVLRHAGPVYERYGRWLPQLAALAFVVLLARSLAVLAWELVPVPPAAQWTPPPVAPPPLPTRQARVPDTESIASAHLFGDYRAAPKAANISSAPDTRLNLTLMGILASTRDKGSRALIGSPDGEEKPYSVGQDVVSGVSLQAVFADRVVLSRNGEPEILRLERDKASTAPAPTTEVASAEDGRFGGRRRMRPETTQQLAQVREEILKDPTKASTYLRIQPANESGSQRGYRIYPGRDRSLFMSAGLRPGDLVTAINGQPMNNPALGLQMLGQLSQATSVEVTIERGGVSQNLSINLNQ